MATFAFRAVDVGGSPSRGEVDASSKAAVTAQLRQRGLIVLDVEEKREAFKLEDIFKRWRRVKSRDLAVLSRQFATMIASGMPMLRALYTLEDQSDDELLKETMAAIRADVEAGGSLAQAMDKHPRVFDRLYTAMVASGEDSGQLETALDRIAFQLEKLDALRRQVRSAMMYPALVMVFAFVILAALIIFIVPVFVDTFRELAAEQEDVSADLPGLTQLVVSISDSMTAFWYLWVPGIGGLIYGFNWWRKSPRGKRQWDRIKLRIPLQIGNVVQKVSLARWSRTFSGLVAAGVPLLQAITITGKTSGNTVIEEAMEDVYGSVRRGGTIAQPLHQADIFPNMVAHMVGVGEESGSLEHMLSKVADFYEVEVDAKVKALTSILEPAMLIFVGGMVGIIVIAMYLPIFSLYDKIGMVLADPEIILRSLPF